MDGINPEKICARSGDFVVKWRGCLLDSSIEPREAARRWALEIQANVSGYQRAIILGVGSGYHLAELCKIRPGLRILAISVEPAVSELAQSIQGLDWGNVESVLIEDAARLMENVRIRNFIRMNSIILDHRPSQAARPELYRELRARLLLRDPLFFSEWVRFEQRFAKLFPLRSIPGGDEQRLLSIKDLDRLLLPPDDLANADVPVFRALRELVR
jgi:hypothetical protein